jgi:hypothetical protein
MKNSGRRSVMGKEWEDDQRQAIGSDIWSKEE